MLTLFHHPLSPRSRYVRLILSEYGLAARLVEERFWERREEFLLLNPACELPVLMTDGQPAVPGASIIAEYIEETLPPSQAAARPIPNPCAPHATISDTIWRISAGWCVRVTGWRGIDCRSPILQRLRICRQSITWVTCRGTRTKQQRTGTRGGNLGPRSVRY